MNKFREEEIEVFSKQFGKSVTCFLMAQKLNEVRILKCIEYMQNSVKQYFDAGFKSANTPITDTIEETRRYLDWLFEASDYLFYLSNGEHLTKDTLKKHIDSQFIYDFSVVKDLCEQIEEANTIAIEKRIQELEDRLDKQRNNSLEVKLVLSHMMNDILKRLDLLIQEDSGMFSYQKKMINAEELKEVIEILREFIYELIEENSSNRVDNTDILINKAVQYIEDNYDKKITLEDNASYVGISKYYFSVLFKKEKDITFSSYLNSVRIEKAKQLLKNPQMTINDVVYEVGFNDPQYFSKTFKKYVGMTITEYRNKYENSICNKKLY